MIKHIIFDWQGVLEQMTGLNLELIDWIRRNKDKYEFSILTNCPGDFSEKLEAEKISDLFEVIVNPDDFVRKPDSEAYKKLLEEVDRKPKECLFIDDNVINVRAAKSLGIESVLYKDNKKLLKFLNSKND